MSAFFLEGIKMLSIRTSQILTSFKLFAILFAECFWCFSVLQCNFGSRILPGSSWSQIKLNSISFCSNSSSHTQTLTHTQTDGCKPRLKHRTWLQTERMNETHLGFRHEATFSTRYPTAVCSIILITFLLSVPWRNPRWLIYAPTHHALVSRFANETNWM